jgi:hypothetical protein
VLAEVAQLTGAVAAQGGFAHAPGHRPRGLKFEVWPDYFDENVGRALIWLVSQLASDWLDDSAASSWAN